MSKDVFRMGLHVEGWKSNIKHTHTNPLILLCCFFFLPLPVLFTSAWSTGQLSTISSTPQLASKTPPRAAAPENHHLPIQWPESAMGSQLVSMLGTMILAPSLDGNYGWLGGSRSQCGNFKKYLHGWLQKPFILKKSADPSLRRKSEVWSLLFRSRWLFVLPRK